MGEPGTLGGLRGSCNGIPSWNTMDLDKLQAFGSAYANAWCSQKPESVAEFFAENGSLTVNAGPPAAGRQAIADIARGFMIAFPDMNVSLDDVVPDGDGAVFHWTLTGTNSGPAGTGRRVRISGRELWRFDSRGLIAHSTGQFDHAEYERQLQFGVDDLSALTARCLAAHYDRVRGKIHVLVEPLSTEQLWTRPFPFGNSVGHLLLHLTGNLNYYIGTQIVRHGVRARSAARVRRHVATIQGRCAARLQSRRGFGDREPDGAARGRLARAVLSGWGRGHHRQARHVPALRRARRPSRGTDHLSL